MFFQAYCIIRSSECIRHDDSTLSNPPVLPTTTMSIPQGPKLEFIEATEVGFDPFVKKMCRLDCRQQASVDAVIWESIEEETTKYIIQKPIYIQKWRLDFVAR